MSTQVRTWTEYCGAEGEPSRWDLSINDRPVPGGYIEKTAEGFEIHYPHLPLKKLTTLEEAKRSLELAPPISTAGLKVGRIADEDSDLISSAEAGEILGVSRFRVNAMVASGVLPGRRDNGKILVDRAAAEQKAAQGLPEGPQGKFANLFLFYAPAGERTQYVTELEADDADSIERARAFAQEVMEDESEDAVEVRDYLRMRNFLRRHENEFEFARSVFGDLVEEDTKPRILAVHGYQTSSFTRSSDLGKLPIMPGRWLVAVQPKRAVWVPAPGKTGGLVPASAKIRALSPQVPGQGSPCRKSLPLQRGATKVAPYGVASKATSRTRR